MTRPRVHSPRSTRSGVAPGCPSARAERGLDRCPPALEARVRRWAKQRLDPGRLPHVIGTVETADRLARRDAPDLVRTVRVAAWLHDVARHWKPADLLAHARANGIPITETEQERPMLLHGAVAYSLAAKELKLDDPLVRSACRNHTVGDVSMGTTDKIVFLADFVEPTRDYPGVELLRRECALGLDRAVLLAIDMTIARLIEKQRAIDPRQLLLRNQLVRAGVRHGGWPEPVEGRAPRCPGSGTDGG